MNEIHSTTDMGITAWDLNELVNLAVENYKKAKFTKVRWHNTAEPGTVELYFIDSGNNIFDQINVNKLDYINIFKPAILQVQKI